MRSKLAAAICLSMTAAVAQLAVTPGGDEHRGSLEGAVTNAVTGEPIVRAHIVLHSQGPSQRTFGALTTAEGKFSIENLPADKYFTEVQRVGFVAPVPRTAADNTVEVKAGEKKTRDFKLSPVGSITGRVVDSDGEPVEGIHLAVEGRTNSPATYTVTDDHGSYRVGGLAPGRYLVRAAPGNEGLPPEIRTDGTVEVHYSPTYYPGSLDAKGGERVAVQAGLETSGIEIRLVRTPILTVSGRVTGLPQGVDGAVVETQGKRMMGSGALVKPDGTFRIYRIDPGKYSLLATYVIPGRGQRAQTAPVEIEVAGSNLENIELRAVPPSNVPGQLEYDDEQAKEPPQRGRPGQQTPRNEQRQILLHDTSSGPMFGSTEPAVVGADGSFTLKDVAPGRYKVALSWPSVYVKSLRLGTAETEGAILDLTNGSGGAPLFVRLSSASAALSGTVQDSNGPAANARVTIISDDVPNAPLMMTTNTDSSGAYSFPSVPPGRYNLLVLDDDVVINGGIWDDYDDIAETVELHASDKVTKDLKRRTPTAR